MKRKFLKIKKVSHWFDVYYTDTVKVSYSREEVDAMFGRFWQINLFFVRFVLVPNTVRGLFGLRYER